MPSSRRYWTTAVKNAIRRTDTFYLDGELEDDKAEWTVGADDFADEWELVRASDEDCAHLRRAGYRG
jgi:hypothetical protein